MSEILEFLERNADAMVADLRAFVERETPSTDRQALESFAAFLAEHAGSVDGGSVELLEGPDGSTHVRAEYHSQPGVAPIVLLGHFDTVWPVGTLMSMPFRVEHGRAHGPGVFDMKGGLVQGLWALRALAAVEGTFRPVVLLSNCDEEVGSPGSRGLIEAEARGAAAVFVLEPSLAGALKTVRKGVARFRVEVTGRAAHAGLDPNAGVSAVEELSAMVLRLHELSDADRNAGNSVNVGTIGGGTRYNVVPARAWADVDVRVTSARDADRLFELIRSLTPRHEDARVDIDGSLIWPPMEWTERTEVLFEQARATARKLGFELDHGSAGGASDGNFCAAVGAPVLDGMGAVGDGAHADTEHLVLAEMPVRAALVAEMIRDGKM